MLHGAPSSRIDRVRVLRSIDNEEISIVSTRGEALLVNRDAMRDTPFSRRWCLNADDPGLIRWIESTRSDFATDFDATPASLSALDGLEAAYVVE